MSGNLRSLREAAGISRKLLCDERAAISVLGAVGLAAVIGISAVVVEYGHGLLQRSDNQRVADLAAYGGALVYGSSGSSAAISAACNIAVLNGLGCDNGTVRVVINGNRIRVTVTTNLPMYLARVMTSSATLPVEATAYADIGTKQLVQ
jgi:uncharacterized membrane protein